LDFRINIERDWIWTPAEAEREMTERSYAPWQRRWIEGDYLIYLIDPALSPLAHFSWQRGTGTLLNVLLGGAFSFGRTIVVREPGSITPQSMGARLLAFPTSPQLVALSDELQKGERRP
jgi:hypothetical protein